MAVDLMAGGMNLPVDMSLLGNSQPNRAPNFRSAISSALKTPYARDLALALLANSRGPNAGSFGQALGVSGIQAQQAGDQRAEAELMKRYREAQIAQLQQQKEGRSEYGQYQPGDYTPQSWARFLQTKDPSMLERYTTPRQEFSPSYQNVTRTNPDGSTQQGTFNTRTGEYNWAGAVVPPGIKPEVDAAGKARGEAAGAQDAKAPVKASFDIALNNMRDSIIETPQGGLFGLRGKAASLTDKTESDTFDSRIQQLSTELRTVFRIPGEGSLSDQEQQQYGLQLPSRNFNAETNNRILKDLEQRVGTRLTTPIGGQGAAAPAAPSAPTAKKRRYNPATGKIE